jgi:hypothetical protein
VIDRIAHLMEHETAGDPISGLKWTQKTTDKIATELKSIGINVSPKTVARLLKQMGYSLRVNHKKLARVCKVAPEDRNAQFEHIAELRQSFASRGLPVISIDTKKKELIGQFKNAGAAWKKEPVYVRDHDFLSEAVGKAVPYGIYDILANHGTFIVGTSRDTAEFTVDALEMWWQLVGRQRYPGATELAILADSGGGNAPTSRLWKYRLHHHLAKRHGLNITVAHYPPGASKWNPIEHRLFSEVSKNWAGIPLDSFATILNYLRTTSTNTGLTVEAHLHQRHYDKGIKTTDEQMSTVPLTKHDSLPKWNYIIGSAPPA